MIFDTIAQFLLPATETDLVTYKIMVNESEPSLAYQVLTMTIQEGVNKIPSAQLVIRDGSASEETFEISDRDIFAPGYSIEILLGYHGNNETVFKGIIISNSHKINSHCCDITVECKDKRTGMTLTNSGRLYENKTDDEVIDDLIDQNQLPAAKKEGTAATGESDEVLRHESHVQSNVTDWDYMISRIDVNKTICLVHNGDMTVKKPDLSEAPVLFLTHGKDIMELQADMDARTQPAAVETYAWDYSNQELIKAEGAYPQGTGAEKNPRPGEDADTKDDSTIENYLEKITSVFGKTAALKTSYMTQGQLKAISDSKMLKLALSPVKGRVKYQGSTKAAPGQFISIAGAGEKFNGKHFVSAIQHEYTDGCWTTEASIGWDQKFFTEEVNPHHPASATGQISTIQGLHTGVVTNIEDPSGNYRVKVKLPAVNDKDGEIYARVATLDAGDKRGTFFRPEIDDEVLIGFVNDDPTSPVILGMLHSSKKQAPLEPEKANKTKGYFSRSGIKLLFDDEKNSVLIETPGGRKIEMDDNAGTVTIQDPNDNQIIMNSNGITIKAALDLRLEAGKSISVKAPQVSIEADAGMSIKGAKTDVTSSGPITIKGAIVKIN